MAGLCGSDFVILDFVILSTTARIRNFSALGFIEPRCEAIATVSYKDDPSIDEFLRMAIGAITARSNEFQPLNIVALLQSSLLGFRVSGLGFRV